ncbi:hypothetical protein [Streptomyces sp. SID12501]|uniref:Uncharacterized protein n=1 Tax=Streptomyces sp. SID12501 TaxID=2706042 RepID=A0A6B3BK12_9ACTN|nr:hypothetical protein [Streptomyces sp. SID12501]NEC84965.1 hypothetical protein [Streptomyces sp. SID12501]
MTTPATTSAALREDDPLTEAIALAVWEQCERQDYRTTNDDPRNIAAVAATVARALLLPDTTAHDDPGPEPEPWPTAEDAYASAPNPRDEFEWLVNEAHAGRRDREWWLRRAAVVDRRSADLPSDHCLRDEHALDLARFLIELDGATVTGDPRRYVRRQYLYWARNN